MSRDSLLMVAGEASGDLHGARLLAELRGLRPELEVFGLGGDEMAAAGLQAMAHSREIAVVGIWEALRVVPRARRILRRLLEEVDARRPGAAVLIDSPDFNLRLARRLEERGVPVVYYVSPQVWAWRRGRIKTIGERVRKMLVLFGFEEQLYRERGIDVTHVGHPLVDEVPVLSHLLDEESLGPERRIALLPGSRDSEVRVLLPLMLGAVEHLQALRPEVLLIEASTVSPALYEECLSGSRVAVERVRDGKYRTLADCHLALCASGTATLEVGLIGTPMIVLYRVALLTELAARLLLRVDSISLVNLVMERSVVPEMLQRQADPSVVAAAARKLLDDVGALRRVHQELADLRPRLGAAGASRRAAAEIAGVLGAAA